MSNNDENIKNVTNKSKLTNRTLGLKRWLSFMVTLSMIMSLIILPEIEAYAFSGGSGTASNPYLISTTNDIELLQGVGSASATKGKYYKLTKNLYFDYWEGWSPNGGWNVFAGTFDGDGHELYIDWHNNSHGLFGTLDGATIKNLGIAGTMENPADGDIGVFAMDATGNVTIENCYNRCSVKTSNTADAAGFILETAKGSYVQFTSCYSVGNMEGRGISGFVGYQRGTEVLDSSVLSFDNCYTVGEFSYTSSGLGEYRAPFFFSDGGGLIGTTNCYTDDLGTQGSSGIGSVQCVTGSTMKSASFISKLGSGFRHDSRNINGGYPILAKQKAPITIGLSGTSYNYDGSRKSVTVSAKRNDYSCSDSVTSIQGQPSLNSADYTLKYNGSTTAPSAAGTYPVTFELTSTGASYFALSNSPSTTLTIHAANPSAPTGVSAARQSNGTVKVSWTNSTSDGDGKGGLTYKVYYGTSSSSMPYTASISSGGTISGLTAGTRYYFKVRATNSAGNYRDSSTVGATPYPDISYTGQTLVHGTVGSAFSDSVAHATGGYGTTTYALASGSSLPAGLSLASNGTVSGTPTTAGTFSFNVTAKNSGGSKTVTMSVTIYPAVTYNGGTLPTGVSGVAYSQSVATATGGYGTTTYSTTARPSNPGSAYYSYIPPGLTLSSNGTLSGTPTSSGTYTFEVLALNDGIYTPASFTVTINSAVWFRNPNTLATALRGSSYYQTVGTATGGLGSYKFAVTSGSLPNGLTLTQDGVIQGTAIYSGTYKFTVTVTDTSGSSDSREFTIAVVDSLSFSGGGGTSDNPYLISTANDLKTMDSMSAGGENFSGKHFKLINDITVSDWDGIDQFYGHFDGNNHVITFKDNCTQGLIDYADGGALIENLGVEGSIYNSNISYVDSEGIEYLYGYIGGIVGDTYHNGGVTIKNCYNAADIGADVRGGEYAYIGGIVGEVYGASVENCYNTGTIEGIRIDSGADAYVGGISGAGEGGTITNCYNAGYINDGKYTGQIIPYLFGASDSLINCYGLSGKVNGSDFGGNSPYGDEASEKGNITIKTADEMRSADFVTALGGAFMRDKAMINANSNTAGFPLLWMNGAEDVTVEWADMSQEYDGNAKPVTVSAKNSKGRTVMLEDGDYTLTYNGGTDAPSSVGSHVTAVTLTEAGSKYFNIASGGTSTLTINAGIPGAPTGLATENNEGGSVKLTWAAPEETGGQAIASYNVYYREKAAEGQPEQEWAVINGIEVTEYTVTNLTPAKVYEFKVSAYNGAKTGAESEVAEQFVAKEPSAPVIGELISKNAGMVITSVEVSDNFGDAVNKYSVYVSRKDEANDTFGEYIKLSDIETETDSTENLLASGLENGVTYKVKVTASNNFGESEFSNEQEVLVGVPLAPKNMQAVPQKGQQIEFSFDPADGQGTPIYEYQIRIEGEKEGEPITPITDIIKVDTAKSSNERITYSYDARDYINGDTLTATVIARSVVADSVESNPATAAIGSPSAPVIEALTADENGIDLSWTESESNGNAKRYYQVTIAEENGSNSKNIQTANSTTKSMRIDNGDGEKQYSFEAGKTYNVYVLCHNSAGDGPISNVVSFTFGAPQPPVIDPPDMGDGELTVKWSAPESNGGAEIIGYNIYLNADTDPTMYVTWKEVKPETTETPEGTEDTNNTETETPAEQKVTYQLYVNDFRNSNGEVAYGNGQDNLDKFEVVIGGLANGYSYDVTVTAVNTNGEGPGKPIEKPITPATKADAPRDLNAKAKSASEVDVTWNAPLKDGGTPVDGYYVTAKKIAYMNDDYTYTEIDEASRTEVYAEFIKTGTQTSITGLDKASRYEITAAAHTAAGYSDDAIINVETHSKPTKPVITELISGVGDAESLPLTVYWEAPESDGGSPILGYDIYINNENHRGYKMNTAGLIPADKTEYKIEDYRIKRGTTYSVSVIAYNAVTGGSMVNGVSSDPMSITLGTVPAPKDVKVTGTLNGDLNVTWPMEQYAGIENYILRYVVYVNDVAATTTTTNSATLTLIPPGEPQKVQVAVVSSFMQEGLKSEPVTVTIGAPEKVTNVTATAIENGTTITWDKDPYLTDDDISNDGFAATKYNFYVDGKKVDTVKAEDISVYTKDIVGLTAGKEYKITVTGENDYGESVVSDAATVTPYAKPEAPVVKNIKSNVKGFSFTFEEPESLGAAITGYKVFVDGAEAKAKIDKDEETGVITATVNDLANGDTHGFYVIAINDKGLESEAPENAYTVVIGVPTAPDKVSAEPGVGSAVITFSKSADVSEDHKTIRYEVLQSGITQPVATVEADGSETYSATVSGLTDRTEYSFSVRAVNDIGEGPASSEVKVTPGTPKAPVISDIVSGNGSLEVKWNAPESNSGSITMYTVYVNDIALKNTVETSINIDGLTNGKAYNVCVTATNYCGESVKSDIETATPGTTSKAVGEIKAVPGYDENGCNITLTWNAPADNGGLPIESYIVESADGSGTITVDSANRTAVITNLEVGTAYSFTITPVNNAGNGEAKSTGEINTLSAPAAPTLIGADGSNKRVTATWSATNDELAPITGYVVYAKQVDVGENEEPVVLKLEVNAEDVIPNSDGEMSASIVDGVKEGYRYDVTVTAVNAIGESVASNSTRVTVNGVTVPTKPGAPVDLKAVAGDKSVTLTWKAPVFDGNSTIRKYYIWAGNSKDDMGRVEEVDGYTFTCTVTRSNGAELKNGQEYFFKVRAVNDVNAEGGEFSETISATPVEFTAPSAPTWLDFNNENGTSAYETNAQGNELTFYWNASESDPKFGQVTYTVYIDGNAVGSTTDTSFIYKISDEGMQQNIKYNVQVRAANENKIESPSTFIRAYRGLNIRKGSADQGYTYPDQYANGIYAYIDADKDGVEDSTTSVPTPAPTPAKPSAPQEFKIEPSGNDAILTWMAPKYDGDADIEKYKISVSYVSAEGRDSEERVLGVDEVTNGGAATLALTDEEASNGNSGGCIYTYKVEGGRYYDFGVSAINAKEVEGDVATATLNTLTSGTSISAPSNLIAEVQKNLTDVKLTWKAVSGATAYVLYVDGAKVADLTAADLTDNEDGTVSYIYTGDINHNYRFAVSAKKDTVESALSNAALADTHETKPEVPQNVHLTAVDNMLVTWEAPSNADQVNIAGYNVQVNGVTIKDGDNDLLINDLSYVAADTVQTMLVSVRAVTALGTTSDWSETVLSQLNPGNFDLDTPAVPNSLRYELQNADDGVLKKDNNIIITWSATEPYTEHTEVTTAYNVYIYAEEGANPEDNMVASNITDTTLTYTLPSAGRPYVIEVESIAANGKVGPKAATVAQVPANEYSVTPVTTLAAQLSDDKTTATLTWDNVSDAEAYYLVVNGVKQDTPVTSPCTWTLDSTVTNHSFVVLSAKTYSDGYEAIADVNESNEATVNVGGDDPNPGIDYSSNKPVIIQYISNGLTNAAASKVFWKAPEPKQNENGTISEYKVYEVNNGTETPIGTVAANASSLEQSITFAAVTDVKTIKIEACKTVEGVLIPASDVEIKVSPSCNVVDGSTYENPTVPVDDSKISSPDNNFDGQPDPIDVENTFTITGKANANGLDIKVVDEFKNELKATKVEYGEKDADGMTPFTATFNANALDASATTYNVVVTRAIYTKYTMIGVPKAKLNALEINNVEIYVGDIFVDGIINGNDLMLLQGRIDTEDATFEMGDLYEDGMINGNDIMILKGNLDQQDIDVDYTL